MTRTSRALVLSAIMILSVVAGVSGSTVAKPPGTGNGPGNGHGQATGAIVVDDGGDCQSAAYESIQNAVANASAGDTVQVCDGTYREQVVITKDLTLEAKQGHAPTIESPDSATMYEINESAGNDWRPIVFAYGGDANDDNLVSGEGVIEVSVKGFEIDGRSINSSSYRHVGVFYRNADGTVADNTVERMGVGGGETFGILAYGNSEVTIADNHVSEYERGGIGANGDGGANPGPTVTIEGNVVNGSTGIKEAYGPNGIQVGFGAKGKIVNNVVKNNRYSTDRAVASGILVFESDDVQIRGNTIENADAGIGIGSWGLFAASANDTKVMNNDISDVNVGVHMEVVSFGASKTNSSVSDTKVVNNELTDADQSDDDIGIQIQTIDLSADSDPVASNNKLINNELTGFNHTIVDGGAETKLAANEP